MRDAQLDQCKDGRSPWQSSQSLPASRSEYLDRASSMSARMTHFDRSEIWRCRCVMSKIACASRHLIGRPKRRDRQTQSIGIDWAPPILGEDGCVPILAGAAPLSKDGRGVVILFECAGSERGRHLVIAALPDDGLNGVFDEFGRARVFDSSESILEPDLSTHGQMVRC